METLTSQNAVHSARTSFLRLFFTYWMQLHELTNSKRTFPSLITCNYAYVRAYVLNAATNHQPFGMWQTAWLDGAMSLHVSTLELCPPALLR